METYIDQLLEDLQAAARNPPAETFLDGDPRYLGLDYIEEWENAPYQPFGEVMGIDSGVFPPDDRLTDGQIEWLIDGILELWASRGLCAELPEELPLRLTYRVLIGRWNDEPIQCLARGGTVSHLTFCDCDPATCVFGAEFCECAKFIDKESKMPPREGDELPF